MGPRIGSKGVKTDLGDFSTLMPCFIPLKFGLPPMIENRRPTLEDEGTVIVMMV
jgi:hypothetical protein